MLRICTHWTVTPFISNAGSPALPRVRGRVAAIVPQAQKVAVTTADGQTNIHNYMTSIFTVGEGASGPPRDRGPV